jgi:hypothetical protein
MAPCAHWIPYSVYYRCDVHSFLAPSAKRVVGPVWFEARRNFSRIAVAVLSAEHFNEFCATKWRLVLMLPSAALLEGVDKGNS